MFSLSPRSSKMVKGSQLQKRLLIAFRIILTLLIVVVSFVLPNILQNGNAMSHVYVKKANLEVQHFQATNIISFEDQYLCGKLEKDISLVENTEWIEQRKNLLEYSPSAILIFDKESKPSSPLPNFYPNMNTSTPSLLLKGGIADSKGPDTVIFISKSKPKDPYAKMKKCMREKYNMIFGLGLTSSCHLSP